MIVSKPKISTLFSLSVFQLLLYSLVAYLLFRVVQDADVPLWMVILLGIAGGVALAVSVKTFSSYKKIYVSKNRIDMHYAWKLFSRRYYFKELEFWEETSIRTATGTFKELTLCFGRRKKVRLTMQENDNYGKIRAFMQRNFAKKQK